MVVQISKELAATYFKTLITGKRTSQKYKKCDWCVNVILATKILYLIPKSDKFDICFRKKIKFEDFY